MGQNQCCEADAYPSHQIAPSSYQQPLHVRFTVDTILFRNYNSILKKILMVILTILHNELRLAKDLVTQKMDSLLKKDHF